jgi:putative copper resistance protein D
MVQHLMLLMMAPPLLVAGQPVTLLLHAGRNPLHTWAKRVIRSRPAGFLTWPPFGFAAYAATIVGTHLTALARLVEQNQILHNAEHVVYLVVGYLFFLPLVGHEPIRWRASYPMRLLALALAMPVDTFTGLVLGYAGRSDVAAAGPRPPGAPAPVEDLHWAGAVMWIGGDAIMLAFIMIVVWMWSRDQRADSLGQGWLEAARRSRLEALAAGHAAGSPQAAAASGRGQAASGRVDEDDEHLAAYNAYLARLNSPAPDAGRPPG